MKGNQGDFQPQNRNCSNQGAFQPWSWQKGTKGIFNLGIGTVATRGFLTLILTKANQGVFQPWNWNYGNQGVFQPRSWWKETKELFNLGTGIVVTKGLFNLNLDEKEHGAFQPWNLNLLEKYMSVSHTKHTQWKINESTSFAIDNIYYVSFKIEKQDSVPCVGGKISNVPK